MVGAAIDAGGGALDADVAAAVVGTPVVDAAVVGALSVGGGVVPTCSGDPAHAPSTDVAINTTHSGRRADAAIGQAPAPSSGLCVPAPCSVVSRITK